MPRRLRPGGYPKVPGLTAWPQVMQCRHPGSTSLPQREQRYRPT
ncbi:MAG: hypothetical protein R2882_02030 [Gemmatimonadales bacterium]